MSTSRVNVEVRQRLWAWRWVVGLTALSGIACVPGEALPEGDGRSRFESVVPPTARGLGSVASALARSGARADAGTAAAGDAEADAAGPPSLSPPADAGGSSGGSPDAGAASRPSNDCCTASPSGGCRDPEVEACVCEGDPFCCTVEYDAPCARQAVSRCALRCDERPPESDCRTATEVPGCTDPEIEACICDIDPFCCVFRFDENCAQLGLSRCGAAIGPLEVQP